ncbi:pentapeptide repeat-containing protein [bacterium]|nr:pentapeptide repeat-containing protein [bacterium]
MAEAKKCQGKHYDEYGRARSCDRDATHDNGTHCIFHAEDKPPNVFKERLIQLVRVLIQTKATKWDFSGFVFIFDEPDDLNLEDSPFIRALQVDGENTKQISVPVSFDKAIFETKALLHDIEFRGCVSFKNTIFKKVADFTRTTIRRDADFSCAKFRSIADFKYASFFGIASFKDTAFYGTVNFRYASFMTYADCNSCIINGHVQWIWPGIGKKPDDKGTAVERGALRFTDLRFMEHGILDFRDNALQKDCTLEFHKCPMENILLKGTDCTQIKFHDNIWPIHEDRFYAYFIRWLPFKCRKSTREVVGDEFQIEKLTDYYEIDTSKDYYARDKVKKVTYNPDPACIRCTYQQLAKRFREDNDYQQANEFDCGTLEMRRQQALREWEKEQRERKRISNLSTYLGLSFYKYLSHYGSNLGLLIIWWIVLLIVCAFIYGTLTPGVIWGKPSLSFILSRIADSFCAAFIWLDNTDHSGNFHAVKVFQGVLSNIIILHFLYVIIRRFRH